MKHSLPAILCHFTSGIILWHQKSEIYYTHQSSCWSMTHWDVCFGVLGVCLSGFMETMMQAECKNMERGFPYSWSWPRGRTWSVQAADVMWKIAPSTTGSYNSTPLFFPVSKQNAKAFLQRWEKVGFYQDPGRIIFRLQAMWNRLPFKACWWKVLGLMHQSRVTKTLPTDQWDYLENPTSSLFPCLVSHALLSHMFQLTQ